MTRGLHFEVYFGDSKHVRCDYMYVCNSSERKLTHLRTKQAMQDVHKQMIHPLPPYLAKPLLQTHT
jgi:hypothetical protein